MADGVAGNKLYAGREPDPAVPIRLAATAPATARRRLQRVEQQSPGLYRQHNRRGFQSRDDSAMNAMQMPPITLPAFSQLLEPAGVAPALDFASTGQLVYTELPSLDYRARVRFVISDDITFRPGSPEEV